MNFSEALQQAFLMIFSGDRELYYIAYNSLSIAIYSVGAAGITGIPLGGALAFYSFPGKREVVSLFNTLMSLPTVVVGLFVYSFISRSGPLGDLGLLFTPAGIVIGQSILIFPYVVSLVYGGLSSMEEELKETLLTLGAGKRAMLLKILSEGKPAVIIAILSAFGRAIGEVGIAMMLGGNIRGFTRTITTAMALETAKGAFSLSLALGIILLCIAFGVNFSLHRMVSHDK
ncbi:MAG: ABC transporter permease [Spirochaetaceae bacterium]